MKVINRSIRPFLVAAMALAAGGCSSLGGELPPGDPFDSWDAETQTVILDIDNRNLREARIYALWNGMRTRVGEVRPMDGTQLHAEYRDGNLRIEVDFVGGGDFVSQPYAVQPGDVVRFRIPR